MKTTLKNLSYLLVALLLAGGYSCSKDDEGDGGVSEYFFHDGHSYLLVMSKKGWTDAAADAVARGGYLVEIGSQAEQDAVYAGIKAAGVSAAYVSVPDGGGAAYVWIGATDRASEGKWMWNGSNASGGGTQFWQGTGSGSAVGGSYHNWGGKSNGSLNEPDNFTDSGVSPNGQNAAAIGLAKWPQVDGVQLGRFGEWNDIAETNKIYYVVEFDKVAGE